MMGGLCGGALFQLPPAAVVVVVVAVTGEIVTHLCQVDGIFSGKITANDIQDFSCNCMQHDAEKKRKYVKKEQRNKRNES